MILVQDTLENLYYINDNNLLNLVRFYTFHGSYYMRII